MVEFTENVPLPPAKPSVPFEAVVRISKALASNPVMLLKVPMFHE